MKHNQLYNELTKAGCFITRHGAEHDEWFNPKNGMKIRIPRHGSHEVKMSVLRDGHVENSFYGNFKQISYTGSCGVDYSTLLGYSNFIIATRTKNL